MKNWIMHHLEPVLAAVSVVFIVVIVLCYISVMRTVGRQLAAGLNPDTPTSADARFNLDGASKLDLKGLTPSQLPPEKPATPVSPSPATTTATTTRPAATSSPR